MREGDIINFVSNAAISNNVTVTIPYISADEIALDKDLLLSAWINLIAERSERIERVLKIVPRNHFLERKYPELKKAGDHYDTNPALFADKYRAQVKEYEVLEKLGKNV